MPQHKVVSTRAFSNIRACAPTLRKDSVFITLSIVFKEHLHRACSDDEGFNLLPDEPPRDQNLVLEIQTTNLVGLTGLEPVTLRLSSACSNQLSYRPLVELKSQKSNLKAFLQALTFGF